MFTKEDVVFTYTVQEAVEDGMLADISEYAKEIGCRCRVVMTTGVYEKCIFQDLGIKDENTCSMKYNMPNLIRTLRRAIFLMQKEPKSRELPYICFDSCDFTRSTDANIPTEKVQIKIVFGADFDGTSLITILLPHED